MVQGVGGVVLHGCQLGPPEWSPMDTSWLSSQVCLGSSCLCLPVQDGVTHCRGCHSVVEGQKKGPADLGLLSRWSGLWPFLYTRPVHCWFEHAGTYRSALSQSPSRGSSLLLVFGWFDESQLQASCSSSCKGALQERCSHPFDKHIPTLTQYPCAVVTPPVCFHSVLKTINNQASHHLLGLIHLQIKFCTVLCSSGQLLLEILRSGLWGDKSFAHVATWPVLIGDFWNPGWGRPFFQTGVHVFFKPFIYFRFFSIICIYLFQQLSALFHSLVFIMYCVFALQ